MSTSQCITPTSEAVANATANPDPPLSALTTYIAVGTFSGMSTLGVLLFVPIFVAIVRNREKTFNFPYFKFLLALGVAEVGTMLCYGPVLSACLVRSLQADTGSTCQMPEGLNRLVSSVGWFCVNVEFFVDPLVAFERMMAIVFPLRHKVVFGDLRTTIWACVAAWIANFISLAPLFFWVVPVVYVPVDMTINYENWDGVSQLFNFVQSWLLYTLLVLSAGLYALSIVALVVRRVKKTVSSTAVSNNMKPEIRLLIQAFLRFSLLATFMVLWWSVGGAIPTTGINFLSNVIQLAIPLNSALVTIFLNVKVRAEVGRLLAFRGTNQVSANEGPTSAWQG